MISANYVNSVTLISLMILFMGPLSPRVTGVPLPSPVPPPPPPMSYKNISIVGEVFCKSCNLPGYVKSMDASPITGAVVRVVCYDADWKYSAVSTRSGENGFFSVPWQNVSCFIPSRCFAFLDWSPLDFCNVSFYPEGFNGASVSLVDVKHGDQGIYSPGALMYGPASGARCPSMS